VGLPDGLYEGTKCVVPIPATWDAEEEAYDGACWTQAMEPDALWMNYYAGYVPPRGLTGCQPLSNFWARNIAVLACSRLMVPLCTCGPALGLVARYREDKSEMKKERSFYSSETTLLNPFGTTWGEEWVWKRIKKFQRGRSVGR